MLSSDPAARLTDKVLPRSITLEGPAAELRTNPEVKKAYLGE